MAFPSGFAAMERVSHHSLGESSRSSRQTAADARAAAEARSIQLRVTETRVVAWIEEVTSERRGAQSTARWLSSGLVLCQLVNRIVPGLVKENEGASQSCKIENIRRFLQVAQSFGVYEDELFAPFDIIEQRDMFKVVMAIRTFAEAVPRAVPRYGGPQLGEATNCGSMFSSLITSLRMFYCAPPAPMPVQRFEEDCYEISDKTVRGSTEVSLRFDNFTKVKSKQASGLWKSTSVLSGNMDVLQKPVEVACMSSMEEDSDCDSAEASTHCGSESGDRLVDIEI